jgi:parvulin-like peptidyl-prolyl isomerase
MEASNAARSAGRPTRWFCGLISLAAVAAVAIGIRALQGPSSASAQTPVKTPSSRPTTPLTKRPTAQQPAAAPAARPAAGASTAPAAAPRPATTRTPPPISSLKVMAVVNAEPISRQDLGYQCLRRYGEEVLESLVNVQLINEALKSGGIQITDKDVALEIDRIAAKFNLPTDRWLALLREERGFTEAQYRREVVWPMLALRKLSAADVQVTKEELQRAFESEYGPKVRARMIILPTLQKAQAVHAEATADLRKFGPLAKEHCEDPNIAAASGVIPPIGLHMGSPEIEQAAFALKKGEISQPIAVANKYVILYCEDRIPEQYVATQNLPLVDKQLTEKLREEKTRRASSQFFAKMQETSKVVNVWSDPAQRKAQPGVAATINGKPITIEQLQNECLERYGADVLEGEINRKILEQELGRRKITITQQDLDAEVARAAESYGVFKKGTTEPDVDAWLKQVTAHDGATVDIYQDDAVWPSVALKKLVGDKVQVTNEDLQKGFESSYGERVEVLAIVLGDQRQAQRVWDDLRKNPTQAYFEEQAENYSIEPASRANRGKVPPIRRHSGAGVIEQEAFKLKAGELSGIVAVDEQFIILRCVGRTQPVQVDFESVKNNLYKDLHEKKIRVEMNKEFDRLLASAQIDNYLSGTSQTGRRTAAAAGPAAPATKGSSKLSPIRSGSGAAVPSAATPSKPKTTR